jgi:hypothetical protein
VNREEATQWLGEWYERFPRSDLFTVSRDPSTGEEELHYTDLGRAARDKMLAEAKHMSLEDWRKAAAAAEIETPDWFKIGHVFEKAKTMRVTRHPTIGVGEDRVLIPPWPQNTIVRQMKLGWVGWVDVKRKPPSIWWLVVLPGGAEVAFPTQYFEESKFDEVEALPEAEAAPMRAEWRRRVDEGSLEPVGLADLLKEVG